MIYIFGDYTLNHDRYEIRYKDERLHLEPQVFEVLAYLVQHGDRVVSKHELFEHLWPQRYVSDKALVRCIQKIRHAIQDHPHAEWQSRLSPGAVAGRLYPP